MFLLMVCSGQASNQLARCTMLVEAICIEQFAASMSDPGCMERCLCFEFLCASIFRETSNC